MSNITIPDPPNNRTDIKNRFEKWKNYWSNCISYFNQLENLENLTKLISLAENVASAYHVIQDRQLGDQIFQYTCELNFHAVSGRILTALKNRNIISDSEALKATKHMYSIHWNATDVSRKYCEAFCADKQLVETTIHFSTHQPYMDLVETNYSFDYLMNGIVCTLYNIVRHSELTSYFALESVKKSFLYQVRKSNNENLRVNCTLALAYLVDESERDLLTETSETLTYLVKILNIAVVDGKSLVQVGNTSYHIDELLAALSVMTVNDTISEKFITGSSGVDMLLKLCVPGKKETLNDSTKILWNLLFNEKNRKLIEDRHDIKSFLHNLRNSLIKDQHDTNIKGAMKNIEGCLWLLEGVKSDANRPPSAKHSAIKPTLFISYCWADKPLVLKVRESLKQNNVSCWIDVEQMKGSTLEAMAEGIEDCSIVLICMSEAYKLSQSCRMEAEYAFKQKKEIIPLLIQEHYKPNGWLGILLGAKLYFDFSGHRDFQTSLMQLLANIQKMFQSTGEKGKDEVMVKSTAVTSSIVSDLPFTTKKLPSIQPIVLTWTDKEVANWLKETVKLSTTKFKKFDGEMLVELIQMFVVAPQSFYSIVREDTKLDLADLMKLTRALRALANLN